MQIIVVSLVLTAAAPAAQAQYRPPPRQEAAEEYDDSFDGEVSLERFRRGNPDWDTQDLIASGFSALHKEHQKILEKLEQLEKQVSQLERGGEASAPKKDHETAP